jgi:hypothetical protein
VLVLGLGVGLAVPRRKKKSSSLRNITKDLGLGWILWIAENRCKIGTWNVRSLYKAGLLIAVAKEILKYKLDLVGVQEVRWTEVTTNQQANIHFCVEGGKGVVN